MSYVDFREWLGLLENRGELKHISGANWDLEMGAIAEIVFREGRDPKPALLFDDIPGYPKGYRTLFGLLTSPWRIAKTLGLPEDDIGQIDLVKNWRNKAGNFPLIPPKIVNSSPVLANSLVGDQVDLLKLPSPRFHELDRSRYIGTAHAVIQRDPDAQWINLGTYRVMVVDKNRLALHILEGQHGGIIMHEKYFARGHSMPVAIAIGVDPALYWSACRSFTPWGVSEYDYAGGIKGEPLEVIEGEQTGLLLPASAEIVIEGECHPGDLAEEGPFGEWHGYYANLGLSSVPEPVIQVKAIYYRDNPILTCAQPAVPPNDFTLCGAVASSAGIWNRLEANSIPGVKGVWCHEMGNGVLFNVISIEQLYSGHARQAGLIASQYHAVSGRYTVVVEEDIDPSDLEQVIWAMITRALPDQSIQILERCRSGSADPAIPLAEKMKYQTAPKPLTSSRVVIDACRPLEWKKDWYPIARISPELRTEILKKWQPVLHHLVP
ncbi:MAG: UbiD family decarboxylase [Chloroflexi bacterium]|nr:UbiD family decarboxylase [Chloroflexota bacterium]